MPLTEVEAEIPRSINCARLIGVGLVICVLALYGSFMLGYERFAVPKEFLLHLSAWGGALLFLRHRRIWLTDSRLMVLCGVFIVGTLLATIGVTNGWYALRTLSASTSAMVLFMLAIALTLEKQGGRLIWFVAIATVAASLTALAEALNLVSHLSMTGRGPGGTVGNRNFLSHFLVVGSVLVVLELSKQRRLVPRLVWTVGLACIVAAITLSRSRGSWLASTVLLCGAAAVVIARWPKITRDHKALWGAIATVILVGTTSGVFAFGRSMHWSTSDFHSTMVRLGDHRSGTGRGRVVQYAATLRMLADHPLLGVGPGQWSIAYPAYAQDDDPTYRSDAPVPMNRLPSSDWIGLAAENGLPLVGIVLAIGLLLLKRAWRQGITKDAHAAALVAILIALAVLGTFDGVLFRSETVYVAAVALGAMAGACAGPVQREIRVLRVPWLVAASAMFVVAVGASGCRLAASVIRGKGATPDLERAFRLDPGNFALASEIAQRHLVFSRCDLAMPYARAALRLCPLARQPKSILESCAKELTE